MATRLMLRITAPIFFSSFLVLAIGIGSAWYLHGLLRESSAQLVLDVPGHNAAQEVVIAMYDVRTRLNRYLIPGGNRKELEDIPALLEEVNRWLKEGEKAARSPRERELIERIRVSNREFLQAYDAAMLAPPRPSGRRSIRRMLEDVQRWLKENDRLAQSPREQELFQQLLTSSQELLQAKDPNFMVPLEMPAQKSIQELRDEILLPRNLALANEYLDLNQETVQQTARQIERVAEWMVLGLILLGASGAVAGLLTGYGIARGISSSLVQLSVPIRDAAGKLDTVVGPVTVSGGQSFGELQAVLEKMAGHVGQVVERFQQSQRQALRAEQLAAVGQLAAGIAHELRNPLTAMKILVQAGTERPGLTGLRGRDLTVLEEEITRLEKLISTFLDFARPPQLEKRALDLRAAIGTTVGLLEGRAEQGGVHLAARLPDEPIPVEADPGQMRQLLLNLLLNALEASAAETTVEIEIIRDPAGAAVVRVRDEGCGLPGDLGERIFDPFVSTKETGIGLGLSICKRIVEAHGGSIAAFDRPGGGAVFIVRLPCVPPSDVRSPPGMQLVTATENGSSQ